MTYAFSMHVSEGTTPPHEASGSASEVRGVQGRFALELSAVHVNTHYIDTYIDILIRTCHLVLLGALYYSRRDASKIFKLALATTMLAIDRYW